MKEIISLCNVAKKFNGIAIVQDITFHVGKGTIFGMLGPSGVGKTTIIKMLTNQIRKDAGEIAVFGCNINQWDSSNNKRIGIMADNIGLYERLTCFENLDFYCKLYQISNFSICNVLDSLDLSEAKDKKLFELSKGMKQRLSLARAMIHSPEILFLDEPTSDLDPHTTQKIHELIKSCRDDGMTVFLTTHDMDEAAKLCDQIVLLSEGRIVEQGNPIELCQKYNLENNIIIVDRQDNEIVLKNDAQSAATICHYFEGNNVKSIRSSEPDLENLFIRLTGKGIQKDDSNK